MASVLEFAKSTLVRALGPQGPNLPFSIGEPQGQQDYDCLWRLHKGTKKVRDGQTHFLKDDGSAVTVFIMDLNRNPDKKELARNALKKARTIRHPNVLKFIDGAEVGGIRD